MVQHEIAEELLGWRLRALVGECDHMDELSRADHQERDLDILVFAINADHVLIAILHRGDDLLLAYGVERLKLIARDGGVFITELCRGLAYLLLEARP